MSLDSELSQLGTSDTTVSKHIQEFRKNHNTCSECLNTNKDKITVKTCLGCKFYKEKTLNKTQDARTARKLVSYFYTRHPLKSLVPNKSRDVNCINRALEYLSPNQVLCVLNYMHDNLIFDINQLHYIYNQALVEKDLKDKQSTDNTASQLVFQFYNQRSVKLSSPNWIKEVLMIEKNLCEYELKLIQEVLDSMRMENYSDLRLFNYIRNQHQVNNMNMMKIRQLEYEDQSDELF